MPDLIIDADQNYTQTLTETGDRLTLLSGVTVDVFGVAMQAIAPGIGGTTFLLDGDMFPNTGGTAAAVGVWLEPDNVGDNRVGLGVTGSVQADGRAILDEAGGLPC